MEFDAVPADDGAPIPSDLGPTDLFFDGRMDAFAMESEHSACQNANVLFYRMHRRLSVVWILLSGP